jgi:hypothetical protein
MRLLLAFVCLASAAVCGAQAFVVRKFDSNIELQQDGRVKVRETLDVQFNEDRHGIFRFIPTALENGKGSTRAIFITGIDTGGDTAKITQEGPNLKIRLGDKDVMLPAGTTHTYHIDYTVENAINWFDHDDTWKPFAELYWNVTGNEWEAPIQETAVHVRFPHVASPKDVRVKTFAGPYGSTAATVISGGNQAVQEEAGGSGASMTLNEDRFEADRNSPLNPGEGLTVVLDVPYDLIQQPSTADKVRMFLLPNLGFTLPIWTLLLGLFAFLKFGKDPRSGPVVTQFDSPEGMSGPECGALLDERVDQRDLAAGIISLAVKGYLTIEPVESGLIFKKHSANLHITPGRAASSDLDSFESELYKLLSSCGPTVSELDLQKTVAPEVAQLKKKIYSQLVERGYYVTSPEAARTGFGCSGVMVILLLGFLATAISPIHNPLPAIVGGVLSVPFLIWFSMLAPRRTVRGARTWALVRGFEDFMKRAREPELEWLSKQHPDAALFEKYLPHAVAFGITAQWAKAFEGIVHEAPSWYASPYGRAYSPYYFANDLDSINSSVGSAAFVPPRSSGASGGSSGFGGGGFSGGGFGGGGGGSW